MCLETVYQQGEYQTLVDVGFALMPEYTDYALSRAACYASDIVENPTEYGLSEAPVWREEYERQAVELLRAGDRLSLVKAGFARRASGNRA